MIAWIILIICYLAALAACTLRRAYIRRDRPGRIIWLTIVATVSAILACCFMVLTARYVEFHAAWPVLALAVGHLLLAGCFVVAMRVQRAPKWLAIVAQTLLLAETFVMSALGAFALVQIIYMPERAIFL